ncbi:ABC-2 type transport system ATP-binding protein [Salisediminibacterium halotolerans]|uniref:ABC-2 type transport system ATP-binding protein n=2 Tax=Salisediminibacterium halotolerans TaxID=517425 RepID=A0A1H9U3J0_9BACI|nr:ABC-2 type transport system ATP-binding protein [Salisediminibacterium haloalkalitolerans]
MALEMINLHKRFGSHEAVGGLDARIAPGEMFGMLGANGAGKTTTFRMIIGLLDPSNGSVTWQGECLNYRRTHLVGYLPEERGLFPKLTVKEQLVYLMRLNRMSKSAILSELDRWLDRFQIAHYKNKKIEELSKGNQQKIQFMAAVLHRPELLILDEPFSGLDPVNADMLKEAVLDLQKAGATIVFSSHQMHNVEELCEEMIMLKNGKAVLQGHLKDIKRSYGMKSLAVKADYDLSFLQTEAGVLDWREVKDGAHLQIKDEETAERLFQMLAARGFVRKFEVEEPSLHDIFIDQVGGSTHA